MNGTPLFKENKKKTDKSTGLMRSDGLFTRPWGHHPFCLFWDLSGKWLPTFISFSALLQLTNS